MYTIRVEMEDGQVITWRGDADDVDHAEGKAIAFAVERTGEQVMTTTMESRPCTNG